MTSKELQQMILQYLQNVDSVEVKCDKGRIWYVK